VTEAVRRGTCCRVWTGKVAMEICKHGNVKEGDTLIQEKIILK
jgi:hypothetical protein